MTTAERIRRGRKARGWSQATLGARVDVSQVQVSLWETGKASPSPEQLARLESVLGKDLHRRRHAALTALFRTLLHQLMTAELRVHDLDLPGLEATA